ncbi:hypothetical protein [Dyella sp. 20L07]|uniref:hypothetical protein n=1 Tax=Dyella sp. 20L07 TaxID=3384240 RepID=UPI003D284F4C
MAARNWKVWRPTNLQEAVSGCVQFAQERQHKSVEQIADLVAETVWTVYKWMSSGNIPARKIAGLEHACGASYISGYLATSSRKLVIDIPVGRTPSASDINVTQSACAEAITALIAFAEGKKAASETIDYITAAINRLAAERANVERHDQPELNLS